MISKLFINRPVVAMVIAIVTVIGGLVAMSGLPVAQFPDIVPPQIIVNTTYTGADALTIEQSVAAPLEQQMSGVDNMLYMKSINANDGTLTLQVTFDIDTLVVVSLYSPKGSYDSLFLGNYATINVKDSLYRVKGVGQITIFGSADYSMRVWVRPDKLASLGLTVADLINAVKAQSNVN